MQGRESMVCGLKEADHMRIDLVPAGDCLQNLAQHEQMPICQRCSFLVPARTSFIQQIMLELQVRCQSSGCEQLLNGLHCMDIMSAGM